MQGLARRNEPVFIITVATSWAGMSVYIERMMAMSSTCSPILGNTSLTSMPDLPRLVNLKGDAIATPFMPGNDLPAYWARAGFGSQVSTCEGAPWAKMWMTLVAFEGKGGFLGASGESSPSALTVPTRSSGPSRLANPNAPRPMPNRFRNWRRVIAKSSGRATGSLIFMNDLWLLCSNANSKVVRRDSATKVSRLSANVIRVFRPVQGDCMHNSRQFFVQLSGCDGLRHGNCRLSG